jgi:tetratricopeptide (TPR) repeat protein
MRLLFLSLVTLLVSCSFKKEQPISDAEALSYAKSIEVAVKKGDKDILNKVLDEDLFADEVVKAAGDVPKRGLKEGIKEGLRKQNLSRQIMNSLGEKGSYEFVRQYQKEGTQHIIFRLFGIGGFNYHDFVLVKYEDKIRAKDFYIFLSGENLSKTMGEVFITMMDADDKASISLKKQIKVLPQIRSLYQQKKFEEAKKIFNRLPGDMRRGKGFQLMNVLIASEMDTETYTEAMDEFERLYGGDPTVQLALFDNYFLRGEYDRDLKILEGLDSVVHDPLLHYYRALVYTKKGDEAAAVKHLEELHSKMPDFQAGALELLAHYMEDAEIEKANNVVAAYKANPNMKQLDLQGIRELYPSVAKKIKW